MNLNVLANFQDFLMKFIFNGRDHVFLDSTPRLARRAYLSIKFYEIFDIFGCVANQIVTKYFGRHSYPMVAVNHPCFAFSLFARTLINSLGHSTVFKVFQNTGNANQLRDNHRKVIFSSISFLQLG